MKLYADKLHIMAISDFDNRAFSNKAKTPVSRVIRDDIAENPDYFKQVVGDAALTGESRWFAKSGRVYDIVPHKRRGVFRVWNIHTGGEVLIASSAAMPRGVDKIHISQKRLYYYMRDVLGVDFDED